MPHLRIETNLPRAQIPAGLQKELCQIVADTLGKPLNYVCVTIIPDVIQSWGGTDDPSAQATLMSIGQLGVKENIKHSKVISAAVQKSLKIDPSRMYIGFQDAPAGDVGYNGTTFHEIFGGK